MPARGGGAARRRLGAGACLICDFLLYIKTSPGNRHSSGREPSVRIGDGDAVPTACASAERGGSKSIYH